MIDAIFFDFGGALDGGGGHWLDRFVSSYSSAGLKFPREKIRLAFDDAEARSNEDVGLMDADLQRMIDSHLKWQFASLGLSENVREEVAKHFIAPIYKSAPEHRQLLANLVQRHFRLGVISNGCGNTHVLCDELGYSPYLSVIIDSRRVNLRKPDPAIFKYAADQLKVEPGSALMVGDSFERDVRAAKKAGMQTAWLRHDPSASCPDSSVTDFTLNRLCDVLTVASLETSCVAG
jgi:HAD superfamily hydrolase (TIGR01549 family)